ncbi:Uncharacterized protein Fot_53450 [Forsythia ovata]|uniref:FAF domain-containing protein n=1 Tax=Forsythia ovata TaxID=205694 RepID=A0ABD1PLA2_9LAMI
MSTIVCQNLVSCFEQSQHVETASLKLKVAPPPPPNPVEFSTLGSDYIPEVKENLETTCWSSLQNLSSTSPQSAKENDSPYIHPFDKKSLFSKTSENISLELCTENLGSESGTDSSDCSIFSNSYSSLQNEPEKPKQESRNFNKAANSSRSFPPPLTTISGGSNSLQVRRHCDGDRLIIQAAVDVEMGMEKFQRLSSRCKESGHGDNWNPALWLKNFSLQTELVPYIPSENTQFPEESPQTLTASFHISKSNLDRLTGKSSLFATSKKSELKISIYNGRRSTTCGVNSGRLLGKISVPLDLTRTKSWAILFHNM